MSENVTSTAMPTSGSTPKRGVGPTQPISSWVVDTAKTHRELASGEEPQGLDDREGARLVVEAAPGDNVAPQGREAIADGHRIANPNRLLGSGLERLLSFSVTSTPVSMNI